MKNTLIIIGILLLCACHKSKNTSPLTQQQIWDSVGIEYEKPYGVYFYSDFGSNPPVPPPDDTLIIHSDKSITEFSGSDTVTFYARFIGLDSISEYLYHIDNTKHCYEIMYGATTIAKNFSGNPYTPVLYKYLQADTIQLLHSTNPTFYGVDSKFHAEGASRFTTLHSYFYFQLLK